MSDYKRIFRIAKHLRYHNLPEDLIQEIFEFVGEINESIDDLKNSHSFTQFFHKNTQICHGTYCHYCHKVYFVTSAKHLARHIRSRAHSENLKQDVFHTPSHNEMISLFKAKYDWCSYFRRSVKKNLIDTLKVQYKKNGI